MSFDDQATERAPKMRMPHIEAAVRDGLLNAAEGEALTAALRLLDPCDEKGRSPVIDEWIAAREFFVLPASGTPTGDEEAEFWIDAAAVTDEPRAFRVGERSHPILTKPLALVPKGRLEDVEAKLAALAAAPSIPTDDEQERDVRGDAERKAFSTATSEAAEKFDERDEEMSWVWLCAKLFFARPVGSAGIEERQLREAQSSKVPEPKA